MPEEIDPAMWARPDLRPLLIGHDIGALYQAVNEIGVTQRRIAVLTAPPSRRSRIFSPAAGLG